MEQVTERSLDQGWEEVPLALLLESSTEVEAHFEVSQKQVSENMLEYFLTPKAQDALFASVQILVENKQINRLTIRDHSDQETVILFRNYESGVVLESNIFELDLPPGTDVIRG